MGREGKVGRPYDFFLDLNLFLRDVMLCELINCFDFNNNFRMLKRANYFIKKKILNFIRNYKQ